MKAFYSYLFSFAAAFVLAVGMSGCSDDDNNLVIPEPEPGEGVEVIFEKPVIELDCRGERVSMAYNIVNPVAGAELSPIEDTEWIRNFKVRKNVLEFDVDANTSAETRKAAVRVSYAGSEFSFEVTQQSYEVPFRLEVPEESVTETTAKFYAYPKDKQMTYLLSSIEKSFKDELGDDETVFKMILANFRETAQAMNLSLPDFLKLNKLIISGDTEELSKGHKPNTEYYAFAVGMTYDGKKTSDIVYTPFRTREVTGVDQSFDIKVKVDGLAVTLDVTPSKDDNYYLYGCISDKQLREEGFTLEQKISKLMEENVAYGLLFGMTSEDVVKAQCVLGHDQKTIDGLDGDTTYWAYAVGVSLSGQLNSELASQAFETGSVPRSDNVITIQVDNIGVDNVHIVTTTTNNDPYALLVAPANQYEGMSDEKILETLASYDLSHNMQEGNFAGTAKNLRPGCDYYVFCFGYLGAQANTDLSKCAFKTIDAGDPAMFEFRSETTDITVRSARVTGYGTPETLLYYWDVVPVGTTDDEIIHAVETAVQAHILEGAVQTPLEYFKAVGARGVATYEFKSLEATTEYVPVALAVDELTGNHVGKILRGTPFTTKAEKLSDATVKVTFDKYWDGDEVACNFIGYEEFGGQNLYCVPLKVETTGTIRNTYFAVYPGDVTDENQHDDGFWIEKLYTKGEGTTRKEIQYFLPYDEDCTIVAVAIDTDGNFTRVFRTVINKSKDGTADIKEFEPFNPDSNSMVKSSDFTRGEKKIYDSGKNRLVR